MYNLYGCLYWHLRSLGIYFVNSQLVLLVIKSYLRQAGVRGLQGQADQLGELKTRHLFIEKLRRCSTNLGSGNTKAVQRHPYITMNSIKRTSKSPTFSGSWFADSPCQAGLSGPASSVVGGCSCLFSWG